MEDSFFVGNAHNCVCVPTNHVYASPPCLVKKHQFTYKRFYELRTFRKKVADRLLRRIRETERQNAGLSGETAELSELTYDNLRELYLAVEQMREQIAQLKSQLDSLSQNANIPTHDIAQINVTTHRLATNV